MGNKSSSSTKTEVLNQAVNDALIKSVQQCSTAALQNQLIEVVGDGNTLDNVEMSQKLTSLAKCASSQEAVSALAANMASQLKQTAEAQNTALLGALQGSESKTEAEIQNIIENHITLDSMQSMISTLEQKQTITVVGKGNTLKNISMAQTMEAISTIMSDQVSKISSELTTNSSAEQAASSKVDDPITNALKAIGEIMTGPLKMFVIIFIVLIVGFLVWWSSGGSDIASQGLDMYAAQQGQLEQEPQYQMA